MTNYNKSIIFLFGEQSSIELFKKNFLPKTDAYLNEDCLSINIEKKYITKFQTGNFNSDDTSSILNTIEYLITDENVPDVNNIFCFIHTNDIDVVHEFLSTFMPYLTDFFEIFKLILVSEGNPNLTDIEQEKFNMIMEEFNIDNNIKDLFKNSNQTSEGIRQLKLEMLALDDYSRLTKMVYTDIEVDIPKEVKNTIQNSLIKIGKHLEGFIDSGTKEK